MLSIFGGPDIGAQKATHQVAFMAELAALKRQEFGAGMLDLANAVETVPHDVLVQCAPAAGYPLMLFRLCLEAYRLKRVVGVEGIYSKQIVATRGITTGAGFADLELRILLLK